MLNKAPIKYIYGLIVVLIIAVTSSVYYSLSTLLASFKLVEHTYLSIDYGNQFKTTVLDTEKNVRSFVLTGNTQFFDNYSTNSHKLTLLLKNAEEHVNDNPIQIQLLKNINFSINLWLEQYVVDLMEKRKRLVAANNVNDANIIEISNFLQSSVYRSSTENIYAKIQSFIKNEVDLLTVRTQENYALANQTIIFIIVGNLFVIICSFPLVSTLMRYIWLTGGRSHLQERLIGEQQVQTLADNVLSFLSEYLTAYKAVMYLPDSSLEEVKKLHLVSTYACARKQVPHYITMGDGLLGQAALTPQLLRIRDIPSNYLPISSGLGQIKPIELLIFPIFYQNSIKGVIEFAFFKPVSTIKVDFLQQVSLIIGAALHGAETHQHIQKLLEETQVQASELRSQQEELASINEELEEQYSTLEKQYAEINRVNTTNQQLQALNRSIESEKQALALASHYKSTFLANMSHELRNPLNSILMLAEIFEENIYNNLNEKQIEQAKTIYNAGTDLLSLINDILDLARIEAGKLSIQAEEFILDELIEQTYQKFSPIAEKKGLRFLSEKAKDLPYSLVSDQRRISQIINNLLSNALKFTHEGEVIMHIYQPTVEELSQYQSVVKTKFIAVQVKDTGIGVEKDKQAIIFEPFQQADGSTNRRYGGTGLGLSISRQLANLLGGFIHLESEFGKGSCFTVYLPIHLQSTEDNQADLNLATKISAPPTETHMPDSLEESKISITTTTETNEYDKEYYFTHRKILVVDDDKHNRFALQLLLESKKMQVLLARNALEALQTLEDNPDIAVVLMDIMMPDIDGYEAIRRIRTQAIHRKLPIIAITAKTLPADRDECLRAGANEYLSKPINANALLTLLKMWLNNV
ncbi:signal transduction histidine kinase [Beggiatoa alba B18LD]|uniref:histidine kinase n=1 Tax=Beggiatoa alba B18LD TaxID=395493 RepID=I3CG82_9GAMM|nr:response regulator [Beggiatoa alba]EIJ42625.1 signal transduction histidine kinase [Beggiatoa alba B18LD]